MASKKKRAVKPEPKVIKAQMKGPIERGPSEVIICAPCTRIFEHDPGHFVGIKKKYAARHLRDHRLGLIRRPVDTRAARV